MYNLLLSGIVKLPPSQTTPHHHNTWEIVYFIDCSGIMTIDEHEYGFEPGSIFFLPPSFNHYEYSASEFTIGYLHIESFFNLKNMLYCFKDTANMDFLSLFKQIYALNRLKPHNWVKIIDGLINVIEQYAISWSLTKPKNAYVEIFEQTLVSSISKKEVELGKLLKNIPLSSSHFRKLFKAETGKSPVEYLMELKLSSAKQLLSNTNLTVKNVAYSLGFTDQYYFSRVFKKSTGKSPTEWRNHS